MKPVLFSVLGFAVRSSSVLAGLGAAAAYLLLRGRRKALGLSLDDFWTLLPALVLGVFAGGVAFGPLFGGREAAADLARGLRAGRISGGSFYGVLLGASAATYLVCRSRRIALAPVADALGAAAMLGLAFVRAGCLLNGCCGGRPTSLPWGVEFTDPESAVPPDLLGVPLHPTQVYEAAGALLVLLVVRRGGRPAGTAFLLALALYAALRFATDFSRGGDPGVLAVERLTTAQVVSIAVLGAAALAAARIRRERRDEFPR